MTLEELIKQYENKQARRDEGLNLVFGEKENIIEESKRTGRTIAQIQKTRSSFMRKANDRQKDMDKIAKQMEGLI